MIVQFDRSIQNCSWSNWFCTLSYAYCGRSTFFGAFGQRNKLFTVINGLKTTLICCCLKIRLILSEMSYKKGNTTKPLDGWSVRGVSTAIFCSYRWRTKDNCCLAELWLVSFCRFSLSVLTVSSVPCVATYWPQISYGIYGGENWTRDSGRCVLVLDRHSLQAACPSLW